MTTRADKALKAQKEKHHAILRELVQEPGNKTCADCLAKGPRWSSWSLGVFVCIRCAGIHRNLGVHISKVKSVDLDSWSTEQIEHILKWGNKRAAEYYECFLPKDFTRPQGNHAVESFIRNKYEKKLYMRKDGEPEPNSPSKLNRLKETTLSAEKDKKVQTVNKKRERPEKKADEKPVGNTILNMSSQSSANNLQKVSQTTQGHAHHVKSSSMNDLLSLDHPGPTTPDVKPAASSNDLLNFGLFADPVPSANPADPFNSFTNPTSTGSDPFQTSTGPEVVKSEPAKSTKESIMSLYSNTTTQQQNMYGVPSRGVYMPQQQPQTTMAYNTGFQMTQMKNQLQQMSYNAPQQSYYQQPQVYNQTAMQQGYMQHPQYNTNMHQTQVNFSATNSPNMPGNMMMSTPNQMNMLQNQQRMTQANIQHGYNVPGNFMSNTSWPTGGQQQQQQFMMNGTANATMNYYNPSGMGTSMGNGMGTNMGHTMNSQLWN